jgi:hypothetical protein
MTIGAVEWTPMGKYDIGETVETRYVVMIPENSPIAQFPGSCEQFIMIHAHSQHIEGYEKQEHDECCNPFFPFDSKKFHCL